MSDSSSNPLRIPRPKIDKLACQAQGAGIFAEGEITLHNARCILYTCVLWYYITTFCVLQGVCVKKFKKLSQIEGKT